MPKTMLASTFLPTWIRKETRSCGHRDFSLFHQIGFHHIRFVSGPKEYCAQLIQSKAWYSQDRWDDLADLFTETHHQLFSLPSRPLLLVALSAGLSALKTPSCHSKHASSTANASSTTTSVCPICSTELNEFARKLPYAHHTKSYVESDPVVLPNGRVYGRDRLLEYCRKVGLDETTVKDPTTSDYFHASEVKKVFIT